MGKKATEIRRGFEKAGVLLLGAGWLGLVFAGMALAFASSPELPALGWALLVLAASIAFLTMNRWVKIFYTSEPRRKV